MFLRQLFDPETFTYTYLVADELTKAAALIDPVLEQHERDLKLIAELGFHLDLVLDTHVHADHITAANALREKTGAKTVQSSRGAPCADVPVGHGDVVRLGDVAIHVLATPGHTDDSLSYLVDGHVFTGDTLLIRGTGRSDFQNGDASALFDSITRVLFALPDETIVLPGHDYRGLTQSTIGEEKRLNPRVAGKSRDEMIAIMTRLDLPPPKKLATAVHANRACGRVDQPH